MEHEDSGAKDGGSSPMRRLHTHTVMVTLQHHFLIKQTLMTEMQLTLS